MMERRASKPYRVEVECEEAETGTRPPNPMISDISTTGLFVDTTVVFDQGAIVKLGFTLPSMVMRVTAEVVLPMPAMGMGMRLLDLTPAQKVALGEVVEAGGSA